MTEGSEEGLEWLVRVRAQVMCRDEGTGGWVALGGGGLAVVTVGRRVMRVPETTEDVSESSADSPSIVSDNSKSKGPVFEYFIYGKRISDQTVVLHCIMKKDFKYNKVMPTFHHWVNEQKRYGLTFQTAADARAFDKGVRSAVADILDGLASSKKQDPKKDEDDENNIFECLVFPSESRPCSEKSNSSPRRAATPSLRTPILSAIHLPHRKSDLDKAIELRSREGGDKSGALDDQIEAENYSYVQLSAVHEYAYPSLSAIASSGSKAPIADPETDSIKKSSYIHSEKKQAELAQFHSRLKCKYCQEWYLESVNRAGVCEFAPDAMGTCVKKASCLCVAECMVYHCISDSEGDNQPDPCSCAPVSTSCATRWLGVCFLSLLVPCLWLYPVLSTTHKCCRAAHIAGGRHSPQTPW